MLNVEALQVIQRGKIEIIDAATLLNDYDFNLVTFAVVKKQYRYMSIK